jgi:hypothetical protein
MYLWSDGGGNTDGYPLNEFKVEWNGITLYDMTDIPASPYTLLSFTVQATGNDLLTLSGLDNGENPGALALDDVSLNPAVPEPSSLSLLGIALAVACGYARQRRRQLTTISLRGHKPPGSGQVTGHFPRRNLNSVWPPTSRLV